ncbi:vascular-related unknown protein 1-like [Solanum lycopersicum]|uniref:vascular-related unknown protein 1-like n=1 Tax=Solanum lycopersicum TaxID=4081 RepID=UPI000276B826|nr:vascular-related unknown protein 1-like [Solanum lycopersicum]
MDSYKNEEETSDDHNNDEQEESGWTTYLEDFSMEQHNNNSINNNNSEISTYCDSFGSPSLLSDAASHVVWNNNHQVMINTSNYGSPFLKRLNLKKPRNNKISDPDLQDTASSPVNSPKVSSFNKQMDINYRRGDNNNNGNFQGFEGSSRQHQEMETIEKNSSMCFDERNKSYMDLKKKGLCLVPLSMLVNYRG